MKPTLLSGFLCAVVAAPLVAAEELPMGYEKPALAFPHFPDRLHAVIWRNWDLVPTERIARVVGATEDQVSAIATAMGLGPNRPVAQEYQRRVYITVVRRNWHLLPYDHLLAMLDMSAEELAFGLREDDFLWHKLGEVKPRCEPVRYVEPDAKTRAHEARIKALVEKHFGDALAQPGEDRLAFIRDLSEIPAGFTAPPRRKGEGPRYIYSYFGVFGDPLLDASADPYPEGLLARLADMGVNGVWLHVVLRQLAPGGPDFPEFGREHEKRIENLRKLIARCKKYGIDIYLYMNEPRAQPLAFYASRPEMRGVQESDFAAMCTSDPRVRRWLTDSLAYLFREAPGLGGVFAITASENLTNCASHGKRSQCTRCEQRTDLEVIAEVNAAVEEGVHRGDPGAKVILWDWGWSRHEIVPDYLDAMPRDTWFLSVSEWSQPFERGGVSGQVGEYSISVVGPGPRAMTHWERARSLGMKPMAKVQLNNTWEISAVPFLPVYDLVAQHCANLAKVGVDGLMMSWSTGGYPSPNLRLAQELIGNPSMQSETALDRVLGERYGSAALPQIRSASRAFSEAFQAFPYGLGLYTAPMQYGPMNLLFAEPTTYGATMVGFPYDQIDSWRGIYPREKLAEQFEKVAEGWRKGLRIMRQAADAADDAHRDVIEADLRLATAAWAHFASCANQSRFVITRDSLRRNDTPTLRHEILQTLDREIAAARALYPLAKADSRIGFEASNHYYYTPLDLVEKVLNCEDLRARY